VDTEQNGNGNGKRGRPSKLTPERHEKIVGLIKAGNYKETAAQCCGIGERTLYDWLERGANGRKPYSQFSRDVKEAEAFAEARNVNIIATAAQGHVLVAKKTTTTTKPDGSVTVREEEAYQPPQWAAAGWMLERTHHERFARKDTTKLTGDKDNPIVIDDARNALLGRIAGIAERIGEGEGDQGPDAAGSSHSAL
jgi:hypothetical protein